MDADLRAASVPRMTLQGPTVPGGPEAPGDAIFTDPGGIHTLPFSIEKGSLMNALVKARPDMGLWLKDVPVPAFGKNDVLVRILKTSICGTDVHIWNWDEWAQKMIPVPMAVGHEFVGVDGWNPRAARWHL